MGLKRVLIFNKNISPTHLQIKDHKEVSAIYKVLIDVYIWEPDCVGDKTELL